MKSTTINQKVLVWARGKIGQRVGKGECWDLADRALVSPPLGRALMAGSGRSAGLALSTGSAHTLAVALAPVVTLANEEARAASTAEKLNQSRLVHPVSPFRSGMIKNWTTLRDPINICADAKAFREDTPLPSHKLGAGPRFFLELERWLLSRLSLDA